jgi:hypothetical protein
MTIQAEIVFVFQEPPIEYSEMGLRIEQEPWKNTTGVMTKAIMYDFLKSFISADVIENNVDCGISEDGCVYCNILVYPYPAELVYTLHASYGELGDRQVEEVTAEDIVIFNGTNQYNLGVVPASAGEFTFKLGASWIGTVFNEEGEAIDNPFVQATSDGTISIDQKAYGLLKVEYTYNRHKYELKISPRDDDTDIFGAVVYGIWTKETDEKSIEELIEAIESFDDSVDLESTEGVPIDGVLTEPGGIAWTEITAPPNADELAKAETECGWQERDYTTEEDEETSESPPTEAPMADKEIIIDYCSQEVISETVSKRDTPYSSSLMGFS